MSTEFNFEIRDFDPEKVYVYPEILTRADILKKVKTIHTIANEDSERKVYCLFDKVPTLDTTIPMQYEVCFPTSYLNLKKYNLADFRVIQRESIVWSAFGGDYEDLVNTVIGMEKYAVDNGYQPVKPYRFLFLLDPKTFLSSKPQKFSMEIQIPIKKS